MAESEDIREEQETGSQQAPEGVEAQAVTEAQPEGEAAEAQPEGEAAEAQPEGEAAEAQPEGEAAEAQPEGEAAEKKARGVKVRRKKSLYAADVEAGQDIDGVFLVRRKQLPVDRTGRLFLAVTLVDRTGRLEGRLWDDAETVSATFREGDHVHVRGQAVTFQGRLQVRLDGIEPADTRALGIPNGEFLQETRSPVDRMFTEVLELVDGMQNAPLKALLHAFLDDPEQAAKFKRAPAAQSVHHAWIGGLLEHTLSTMKLALRICEHYPHVNRDLVLAGCVLHDYGKIDELAYEGAFAYTDQGRLVGHLVLCSQWIHDRAARIPGFTDAVRDQLVHIVVSHHGELAFGSPKRPKTLEALIVHYADVIDARMSSFTELLDEAGTDGWTDYSRIYDRPLFRGEPGGAELPKRPAKRRKRRKRKKGEGVTVAEGEAGASGAGGGARPAREARPPREQREQREQREAREARPPREPRPPREGRPPREEGEGRPRKGGRAKEKEKAPTSLTFNPFAAALAERKPESGEEGAAPAAPPEPRAEPTAPETRPETEQPASKPEGGDEG